MNKNLKYKCIISLLAILTIVLAGIILTMLVKFCDFCCFPFCIKRLAMCIIWLAVIILFCILIRKPALYIFRIFERMYISRKETEKYLPIIISCVVAFVIVPLPVFLFFEHGEIYGQYVSVLAIILGLDGLFTSFIANRNIEDDRKTGEQSKTDTNQQNLSSHYDITGFRIEKGTPTFDSKKYKIEGETLVVADYLGKGSGDNLWLPMNRWYEQGNKNGRDYPMFNARADNWNGNDDWYIQLNEFVEYLKKNGKIAEAGKNE